MKIFNSEHREKIRLSKLGHECSIETRNKIRLSNKGRRFSPKSEFKKGVRISISTEFKKGTRYSPRTEFKKGGTPWNKGKKCPEFSMEGNPNWRGGRINSRGYIFIYSPNHPNSNSWGYFLEHRLIMEKHIGRFLSSKEIVHHINNIPNDNRINNLILLKNCGYHCAIHRWGVFSSSGIIFDGRRVNIHDNISIYQDKQKI